MKMCLAPCFKGCSDEEYGGEVARVRDYLNSAGDALVREIERQREEASAELKFEEAAALHARIDKVKPVLAQLPEAVQRVDRLAAVMVQPCAEPGAVALFRVKAGVLGRPCGVCDPGSRARQVAVHGGARQALDAIPDQHGSALETMEHPQFSNGGSIAVSG
jgi:excinuclease UvrABC nuclease subunit